MPQSRQGPTRFQHQYFRLLLTTEASARPTIHGHAIGYDTSSLMCVVTRPSRCTESSDRPLVTIHKKSNDRRTHPPPVSVWLHLFHGCGHDKRRGEQLKWSLAFRLYIGSFYVHSYQNQFKPPGWAECFLRRFVFCVFICVSLICLHVLILLCFREQLSHLPYSFWR